jgi:uncharacterized protein (TIGR01777 family)
MRVFVTGGTGLVGSRLVKRLKERGDRAVVLTRRADAARKALGPEIEVVEGDPMKEGPWMKAVESCDGVIHLAGENLFARRWSEEFKKLLVDSRVVGTRNVARASAGKVLVSASAIGYYGPHGDEDLDEDSPPGSDFLADLCVRWEAEAKQSQAARSAWVRVGVVLDRQGGALSNMITPFWLGAGGPIGSGRQQMSWIHHADLVGIFLLALDNPSCTGPVNGTAPNPVTNKAFGHALGKAMWRPSFMWTPGFMLRVMLGEVAGVVLNGQRVLPKRALALGYRFEFPDVDSALAEVFRGPKGR